MIGEREDILSENKYGDLNMRPYVIDGNEINAFYDDSDDLVFVLDNTINQMKPNVLLVINPSGDKKWDEILSGQYDVDLETIRPKQDNKYQKLDIEYSGLSVYENLINAYVAGDDLTDCLVQLDILRDSAARHSAMTRLNVANEVITKTNVTIVKTKESIVRLQNRIKILRAKLSEAKKTIGRVSTKQSAAKILKLESQIEATDEKLKRAKKRLESAQRRLETATVDAELASDLLNQPALEIQNTTKTKSVNSMPVSEVKVVDEEDDDDIDDEDEQEDFQDNGIKPLFDKEPDNLDENIAFKPISLGAPAVTHTVEKPVDSVPVFKPEPLFENVEEEETEPEDFVAPNIADIIEQKPVLESMTPLTNDRQIDTQQTAVIEEPKPVLESMTPLTEQPIEQNMTPTYQEQPVVNQSEQQNVVAPSYDSPAIPPVPPVVNTFNADVTPATSRSKPTIIYYILLTVLICLSVFTLWLYQKSMPGDNKPLLTENVAEQKTEDKPTLVERLFAKTKKTVDKAKTVVAEKVKAVKTEKQEEPEDFGDSDFDFTEDELSDKNAEKTQPVPEAKDTVSVEEPIAEPEETTTESENVAEQASESAESTEPEILDAVPAKVLPVVEEETTTESADDTEADVEDTDEINVDKPVYEVGPKHDDMIVSEEEYQASVADNADESENTDVEESDAFDADVEPEVFEESEEESGEEEYYEE